MTALESHRQSWMSNHAVARTRAPVYLDILTPSNLPVRLMAVIYGNLEEISRWALAPSPTETGVGFRS